MILAACFFAVMSVTVTGVTQQQIMASNKLFHSYSLGSYGQHSMRYKSVEATDKVRKVKFTPDFEISIKSKANDNPHPNSFLVFHSVETSEATDNTTFTRSPTGLFFYYFQL